MKQSSRNAVGLCMSPWLTNLHKEVLAILKKVRELWLLKIVSHIDTKTCSVHTTYHASNFAALFLVQHTVHRVGFDQCGPFGNLGFNENPVPYRIHLKISKLTKFPMLITRSAVQNLSVDASVIREITPIFLRLWRCDLFTATSSNQ